jgi:hypothetical protein
MVNLGAEKRQFFFGSTQYINGHKFKDVLHKKIT